MVQEGCGAVTLLVVARLVCLGDDVVEFLLPVDGELDRPRAKGLGQLKPAMVDVSNASVPDGDATDMWAVLPRVQVQYEEVVIVAIIVCLSHGRAFENARVCSQSIS